MGALEPQDILKIQDTVAYIYELLGKYAIAATGGEEIQQREATAHYTDIVTASGAHTFRIQAEPAKGGPSSNFSIIIDPDNGKNNLYEDWSRWNNGKHWWVYTYSMSSDPGEHWNLEDQVKKIAAELKSRTVPRPKAAGRLVQ